MKAPDKMVLPAAAGVMQFLIDDTVYIRKDALLEWAKKKNKRIDTEDGDYSLGYVSAMIDLIEKIESI